MEHTVSGQEKMNAFNIIVKTAAIVIGTLISIIFYEGKETLKEIGKDVVIIKGQVIHIEDRVGTHADAINELKVDVKNLEILKQDKPIR